MRNMDAIEKSNAINSNQAICKVCTFVNISSAKTCEMCGTNLPTTHDIQANGTWKCGTCTTTNRKGVRVCTTCNVPFSSSSIRAAPSEIFCPRCGYLNPEDTIKCTMCKTTIRSTLERITTDLSASTNHLAQNIGMNIKVKCPGCLLVALVPPATACLRCGTCQTYFSSPTVGEVTNFHMNRLASSISSSFFSLMRRRTNEDSQDEIPLGRLIATGESVTPAASTNMDASILATSEQIEQMTQTNPSNAVVNSLEMLDSRQKIKSDDEQLSPRSTQDDSKLSLSKKIELDQKNPTSRSPAPKSSNGVNYLSAVKNEKIMNESYSNVTKPRKSLSSSFSDLPVAVSIPYNAGISHEGSNIIRVEGEIVEL